MSQTLPPESDPGVTGVRFPPPLVYVAGFLIGVALEGLELGYRVWRESHISRS